MYTTSIAFKKKWKPARRETLNQKRELTFEPKERNRRVYSEIRRRVWKSGTEKKKMLSTDLGISLYRDPVQTSPNVRCKEHPYSERQLRAPALNWFSQKATFRNGPSFLTPALYMEKGPGLTAR